MGRAILPLLGLLAFRASRLLQPLYEAKPEILLEPPSLALPPGLARVAAGTLLLFGLAVALESFGYRRLLGYEWARATRRALAGYRPLAFLLPFGLVFLPGFPFAPMVLWWLLLEARPWLATLAAGACIYLKAGPLLERSRPFLPSRWSVVALGAGLLALLALWAPERRFTQPYDERWGTGDEPRYIRITASLLHDADTDIGNAAEHIGRRAEPLSFLRGVASWLPAAARSGIEAVRSLAGAEVPGAARSLGGPVIEGRRGGTFYSYLPGLPLLLVPSMAIDSALDPTRLVVTLVTCLLLSVAATLLLVPLVEPFVGSRAKAIVLALALSLSLPSFFFHYQVYPEVTAAIGLTVILGALLSPRRTLRSSLAFGLACAYLPWLHGRYLPLWGVSWLAFAWRAWRERRSAPELVVGLSLPVMGLALNCLYVFQITGSLLPDALWVSVGYEREGALLGASTLPGLYYLFLDRAEGLLVYAPHYLFVIPGFVALRRRSRFAFGVGLALSLPYVLAAASHDQGGAGGWAPPTRYLVPLVPVFSIALAAWLRPGAGDRVRWTALLAAAAGSFWIAQGMLAERNYPYDRAAFLASHVVDPSPLVGTIVAPDTLAKRAAYPAFLLLGVLSLSPSAKRAWATPPRAALGIPLLVLLAGAVVSMATPAKSWIRPSQTAGPVRTRSSPATFLLPDCGADLPRLSLRGAGDVASDVTLRGPGLERVLLVPSGTRTEVPVSVRSVARFTRAGRIEESAVRVLVAPGAPPVDVEAICGRHGVTR